MSGIGTGPAALVVTMLGALVALGVALLVRRTNRFNSATTIFVPLAPASVAAGVAAAGWPASAWAPALVLAALCAFALAVRSSVGRRVVAAAGTRNQVRAALVASVLIAGVWWAVREPSPTAAPAKPTENTEARRAAALRSLRELPSPVALTDRGRRVTLFEMPDSALPTDMLTAMEAGMIAEWGPVRLIRTGPADRRSDCHGWVFAGGEAWVLGRDVETVLEDNEYRSVDSPATGDLVVYRIGRREITHSGIVCAAVPSRPVLVESKWAWLAIYLHNVDDHPYGGNPHFYRSARAGHRLALTNRTDASAPPSVFRGAQ